MKKKFTFLMAAVMLLMMMSLPGKAVGQKSTMTFDFEDSGAHTSASNNYTTQHTYSQNGVDIKTTYFDCIENNSIGGSYLARGRVAGNTTNSPVLEIGPISIDGWEITGITYYTKGNTNISQTFSTKTDTDAWTTQITSFSCPSASTPKTKTLSISGKAKLYLKWTGSVSSSTKSNRDFDIDNIVITYTVNSSTYEITYEVFPASTGGITGEDSDGNEVKSGDEIAQSADITLTATPAVGYVFSSWSVSAGSLSSTSTNPTTFTMGTADATVTANFISESVVTTPTFTPAAGTYYENQTVEIECSTDGATIYYTTNGDEPTTSSTTYSTAISVTETTTIKAKAFKGDNYSDVASATFTILEPNNITFQINGKTCMTTVVKDATIDLSKYTASDSEHTFAGWCTNPNAISILDNNHTITTNSETLHAVFVNEYTYTLVTDASTLSIGDKVVIAANASSYAMSTTQNENNRGQVSITKLGSNITWTTAACVFELKAGNKTGTLSFYDINSDGYLYAASSSKNYLRTKTDLDNNGSWMISVANTGVATIRAQGTYTHDLMQYNSGSSIFSAYSSAQQDFVFIKEFPLLM